MKNRLIRDTTLILILVVLMVSITAVSAVAQINATAPTSDLSGVINGMGLPQDKFDTTLKLTTALLADLQKANQELTKLMTPKDPGAQVDPKSLEKITVVQREFGIKLEQYHLDLGDAIGEDQASKIIDQVHLIIPQALLQGSKIPVANHTGHSGSSPTVNSPSEVPLGSTPNNTGNQIPGNSNPSSSGKMGSMNHGTMGNMGGTNNNGNMNNMPGMNNKPNINITNNMPNITEKNNGNNNGMNNMPGMQKPGMNNMPGMNKTPGMNNMPGMSNNTDGTGLDAVNRQILTQLQASNAMLIQMLSLVAKQSNSKDLEAQIQPIYQMINNQATLIQLLYSNLSSGSMSSGSGNSGGMGMGMGNMGGMM